VSRSIIYRALERSHVLSEGQRLRAPHRCDVLPHQREGKTTFLFPITDHASQIEGACIQL
jgi:hypothetical protein